MISRPTKYIIAAIVALVGFFAFRAYRRRKNDTSETPGSSPAPAAPAPPAQPGPAADQPQQSAPIDANDEPAATAIKNRVRSLYNSQEREQVYSINNTRQDLTNGLQYRSGITSVLSQVTPGGLFPLIPRDVDPRFIQRLQAAQQLENFEELTRRGAFDLAQSLYRDAFDLSDVGGPNLWPHGPGQQDSQLLSWINAGLFGRPGRADTNKSERFSAYGEDLKVLAANAEQATRKAQQHLKARAIEDLKRAGWNII